LGSASDSEDEGDDDKDAGEDEASGHRIEMTVRGITLHEDHIVMVLILISLK
jgi:hypothetical protein